ncbi:Cupredoxin [Mollisia scopiformis]|uniref:Cupredoxin n=1 Tax=Mollisia scopiformis TaxID=149040 RepID=A0A194XND1_MOLSC|nr:Cupredoxin [Mollisia scopiformis]KUJ21609.1 Cupredoxin [Mollisia scopiformis]
MQFTTFALSALSIGSALAASSVTVHVVQVGAANGTLAYFPNNIKAAVGDMIQFQFAPNNHTVTQSTFDQPCMPIAMNSNVTGVYSGFMPVTASATTTPTYTVMVNATTPMWFYCSQGKHCQNGMTMVVNENTAANSTRSLANFQSLAAKATVNLPGGAIADGTAGSTASNSSSSSSGSSTSSSAGTKSTSASAAGRVRVGEADV